MLVGHPRSKELWGQVLKQKQRSAALKLIGVVVLCACSVPIWLFPAAALDAGVQQAPGSSRADPARGPQPLGSPPPPPGEIKVSFPAGQPVMGGMGRPGPER